MPSSPRLLTVPLVLVGGVLFMGALVPNLFVLAPRYLAGLGLDEQQIGVVMGGANVGALAMMPLAGRLVERVGHRALLVCGCVVAAAGCVAFDATSGAAALTCARVVQGLGFAAVLVTAAAYVAEIAPPGRLAQALGISGVLTLASQAVGPALGELILQVATWPWVFRAGAIGAGIGAVIAACLPPAPGATEDATPRVSAGPILLATALAGFGFGAVWTFLADYADRLGIAGVTPFFVPYVAAAVSARVFLGHLPDTLGRRAAAVPALALHAASLALMAALSATWQLAGIGLAFGLAHGIYYPTLQAVIVDRASAARSRAIASSTFAFGLGIAAGAFGLGGVAKAAGYPVIYVCAAVAGAGAAALVWARG